MQKNGSNRPFLASRVADTIFPSLIEGHHRQLDNQYRDPMNNNKDCRVGQLTILFNTDANVLILFNQIYFMMQMRLLVQMLNCLFVINISVHLPSE